MVRKKTNYEIWLDTQLTDPEFKQHYERALDKLRLGSCLAEYREKQGLTQAQLARKVGALKREIDRLEMADYDELPVGLLKQVATVLGLALVMKVELREIKSRKAA